MFWNLMYFGMVYVINMVDGVNFWGECVIILGVLDLRCIDLLGGIFGFLVVRSFNWSLWLGGYVIDKENNNII